MNVRKIGITVGAVVLGAFTLACGASNEPGPGEKAAPIAEATSAAPAKAAAEEPAEAPAAQYGAPDPKKWKITIRETKKQCFGSAGCLVNFRIVPTWEGDPLDPSKTYEVTYTVLGDEDGPKINTFTVTGTTATFDRTERASTPSSKTKLTAKATAMEEA